MRFRAAFAGLFLLFPLVAAAQSAIQLNPSSIRQYTSEWTLQITGSNLAGNISTEVLFQSQTDSFDIVASSATSTQVLVAPPADVTFNAGTWTVTVKTVSTTGTTLSSPATLTVTPLISQIPPFINTPEVVMAEATSASGANVSWSVSAYSFADPSNPPTPTCSPASGSLFSLGTHTVSCSASDAYGTSSAQFLVVVTDTTAPVLTVPANIATSSPDGSPQAVTFTATATDNVDGSVTPTCKPASGSLFPVGVTTVQCTAIDKHSNYAFGSFTVTVEPAGRPVITVPADITAEATGPNGAAVTYTVTVAPSDSTLSCTPASGSTFALGTTTVQCTATDLNGSSVASFDVTVQDTTPPAISVPSPITAEATGPTGAPVTYTVTANDLVDGSVQVTCTPASGSTFPLDTDTLVQCTATDAAGNQAFAAFTITVVDTTPPALHLPANFTVSADQNCVANVTYTATATDLVDGTDAITCTPPSGTTFGLGTYTVSCTSTDAHNNTATGSFQFTVADTTPPTIQIVTATPGNLWPANHKMVDITVRVVAVDNCDPSPVSHILSVSSNQPINGPGDGNTTPDYVITGALTLQLRAERAQGQDRTYTIVVAATDSHGNTSTAPVQVTVKQTPSSTSQPATEQQPGHGRAVGHP